MIRQTLKSALKGTPLEPVARRILSRFRERGLTKGQRLNRRYDKQTRAIMVRVLRPDANCIDVGCARGAILRDMIRIAPAGSHIAFEPLPHLADRLRTLFPRVTLHQVALSDSNGSATFNYVVTRPGYSGLRERPYPTDSEKIEHITVEVDTLDNRVPADLPISFIKIDVEGGQHQVLAGAAETIRRNKPVIVFEHGVAGAARYGVTSSQTFELLASYGLDVSVMADWLRGKPALTKARFVEQCARGLNFYFVAHPAIPH